MGFNSGFKGLIQIPHSTSCVAFHSITVVNDKFGTIWKRIIEAINFLNSPVILRQLRLLKSDGMSSHLMLKSLALVTHTHTHAKTKEFRLILNSVLVSVQKITNGACLCNPHFSFRLKFVV